MGTEKTKIALVYQAGLANVFKVSCFNAAPFGRDALRVLQADFRTCVVYARACEDMGAEGATFACNMAGDIQNQPWTTPLAECPFADQVRVVGINGLNEGASHD